ncbi:MAG: SDR family NAD(P)-dependent oxidoreductase, partial [Gammaproteobacteria bacterium]
AVRFDGSEFFLRDHVIGARKLLPGVAYLEMARAAAQAAAGASANAATGLVLRNIIWGRPLTVDTAPVEALVRLEAREQGRMAYRIVGSDEHAELVYSSGWIEPDAHAPAAQVSLELLRQRCARRAFSAPEVYAAFASLGIDYGPAHRAVTALHLGSDELLAQLALPPAIAASLTDYVLHPALLDAALQATIGFGLDQGRLRAALPFSMEEVRVLAPCQPAMWVHVVRTDEGAPDLERFDLQLFDAAGVPCVQLRGFTVRTGAGDEGAADSGTLLLHPVWRAAPAETATASVAGSAHHIVLVCALAHLDMAALRALLPRSECERLDGGGAGLAERFEAGAAALLGRIQQAFTQAAEGATLLQVVVPNSGVSRVFAGLAGMLKTASLENPALRCQLIEVDEAIGASDAASILARERVAADTWVRWHSGARALPAWEAVEAGAASADCGWKDSGVYLITGGVGGLGRIVAEDICRNAAAPRLILVGRSAPNSETAAALAQLERLGAQVAYRKADVASELDVLRLLQFVRTAYGQLNGIIHSAGVIRDSFIARKQAADLAQVLAPKVRGTLLLDEASADFALDVFVLFSAGAAVFGNPGQADYAAANGFLDAFAAYRNELVAAGQRHGRTLAIDWPLWQEGGMRVDAATELAMRERAGATAMPTPDGLAALRRSIASTHAQVLVLHGERARLRAALQAHEATAPAPGPVPAAADADDLGDLATAHLKGVLGTVIGVPAARIHADAPMEKYGIDSIMIMQLTTELEKSFGPLSKTLFFEHRNLGELARYFARAHADRLRSLAPQHTTPAPAAPVSAAVPAPLAPAAPVNAQPPAAPRPSGDETEIVIVGVAGRYPQADDLQQFWTNLCEGRDCITEIPAERWDHGRFFDERRDVEGKTYSKWGGFINGVDRFDPLFFNISPREAELMDPQERLFLQCAHEVLEDAGYARDTLAVLHPANAGGGASVGVFVGVMYEEYQLYGAQRMAAGQPLALTGSPSSIANRVSYFYNFQGPSMAIDTMCSSSLTAIHLACQSIRRNECEVAIAGGVNVSVHPNKYLMLAQGSFASSKGRCESFGAGGDGYVPGEGVGALMLK